MTPQRLRAGCHLSGDATFRGPATSMASTTASVPARGVPVPARGGFTFHAGRPTVTRWAALLWPILVVGALLGPATATTAVAGQVTMDARVLLDGHVRLGSWMGVE